MSNFSSSNGLSCVDRCQSISFRIYLVLTGLCPVMFSPIPRYGRFRSRKKSIVARCTYHLCNQLCTHTNTNFRLYNFKCDTDTNAILRINKIEVLFSVLHFRPNAWEFNSPTSIHEYDCNLLEGAHVFASPLFYTPWDAKFSNFSCPHLTYIMLVLYVSTYRSDFWKPHRNLLPTK